MKRIPMILLAVSLATSTFAKAPPDFGISSEPPSLEIQKKIMLWAVERNAVECVASVVRVHLRFGALTTADMTSLIFHTVQNQCHKAELDVVRGYNLLYGSGGEDYLEFKHLGTLGGQVDRWIKHGPQNVW